MSPKSILFVSPGGTTTRAIRVKIVSVIIAMVVIVGGFSAYFIPSEKFRLKAGEEKQKQHLSSQNEMLHQRIVAALGVLSHLRQQMVHLDAKKERVAELTGAKSVKQKTPEPKAEAGADPYAGMDAEALLERASRLESRFMAFAPLASPGIENVFDRVPVCKPTDEGAITSLGYGKTRDPFTGRQSEHRGVDLSVAPGTPVIATAAGTVVQCEKDAVWGNRIAISHADSITTIYAHLGSIQTAKGRTVKRGAVIGTIGSSGLATGPHVHYEIWKNGVAVDPELFFYPVNREEKQVR